MLVIFFCFLFQLNQLSLHKIRTSLSTESSSTQDNSQDELKELTEQELEVVDDEAIAVCILFIFQREFTNAWLFLR